MLTPAALADALSVGCANVPTVIIVSSCYSGSFAAGAMLALVAAELVPAALGGSGRGLGVVGLASGALLMWAVSVLLNV